jgi:hypothetical protein
LVIGQAGMACHLTKQLNILLALDSGAKCNRAIRTRMHVFAKLFEVRLEGDHEAQAFSGREICGDDDVPDFFARHFVDVDLTGTTSVVVGRFMRGI